MKVMTKPAATIPHWAASMGPMPKMTLLRPGMYVIASCRTVTMAAEYQQNLLPDRMAGLHELLYVKRALIVMVGTADAIRLRAAALGEVEVIDYTALR